MKYLPEDLQSEYHRELEETGDIDEITRPLINVSDVLRAYFILADYFSDRSSGQDIEPMLIGVKDRGLLISAICRQTVSFGGRIKYTDKLDICSTLFFGLVKNHSFLDGNKRVSLLILLYQLNIMGYYPNCSVREFEKLVLSVADGSIQTRYKSVWKKFSKSDSCQIKTISYLLRQMTQKKDHSYHISITMKEFCDALQNNGVTCSVSNGKLHMSMIHPRGFFGKAHEIKHTIPFGGWTRVLGAQTARETLQAFEIYEQHPTYKSIMDGDDPLYRIVEEFEQPLRRLKDK